jgi:hypothetical protein
MPTVAILLSIQLLLLVVGKAEITVMPVAIFLVMVALVVEPVIKAEVKELRRLLLLIR